MKLYQDIKNKKKKIAVVGLGYVGLPLAIEFSKVVDVIGFDINENKINKYKNGINNITDDDLKDTSIHFTSNEEDLKQAHFIIVAVPTPIKNDTTPDLSLVVSASEKIAKNLNKDSIVVYESTVYPGVTEDIIVPILEKLSNLKYGTDFKVGYSPERINPGDTVHTLPSIVKVVSASDDEALEEISKIYKMVIKAGVYPVSNIKTAEAVKVIENSQRDVNIAFINEVAMVFDKMGIDTNEVVDAMNTKWNALGFRPGLVGGHCIAVDPYYFVYQSENLGYHNQIISASRKINDGMADYIVSIISKKIIETDKNKNDFKIAILGVTFKENCADMRNSQVINIIKLLRKMGINPVVVDSFADKQEVKDYYDIELSDIDDIKDVDCIVLAVGHEDIVKLDISQIDKMFKNIPNDKKILIDIKGIKTLDELKTTGYNCWRL